MLRCHVIVVALLFYSFLNGPKKKVIPSPPLDRHLRDVFYVVFFFSIFGGPIEFDVRPGNPVRVRRNAGMGDGDEEQAGRQATRAAEMRAVEYWGDFRRVCMWYI